MKDKIIIKNRQEIDGNEKRFRGERKKKTKQA